MKTLMEATIFGETFTITSEDEQEYVVALAASVDQRIRRFADHGVSSPLRAAIMAALSFADAEQKKSVAAPMHPEKRGYH